MFVRPSDQPQIGMDRRGSADGSSNTSHLHAALNGMSAGLLTFNRNLDIVFANDRLGAMLEIPAATASRAGSVLELLSGSAVLEETIIQRLQEICVAAVDAFADHRSTLAVSSGPVSRFFNLAVTRLGDGHWMVLFEEVTARRSAEASALEQAMHDPLTGLPNRQLFRNRVVTALTDISAGEENTQGSDQIELAVMAIDLDRFKTVNDTLGHAVGDGLLRLVSKRLRFVLRPRDEVARLGGDEFALLISPAPDRQSLNRLATRIVDVLGHPYLIDRHLVSIGASIGIAIASRDGREYSQLLRSADLALYQAKKAGRGTFSFFEPEMDARALAKRALEADLRKALAQCEFELDYQPQIDLGSGQIVSFEALIRWRHPEHGILLPAEFIPLAEETGLIVSIGEWVLKEACRAATRWPDTVSVAVNVSPLQFVDTRRLLRSVELSLAVSGLPGNRLEIEVTESALLCNEEAVLAALHRLHAMDVRVAMDDFGTGYSSLSQLNSFPFNKIKIDRSCVLEGSAAAVQNAVIRAISALATSLSIDTVAEGVETADQLSRIRADGCTLAQGFLISRPVPAGQIAAVIYELATRQCGGHSANARD